jgi:tetratricopeptide (TPR) repeat protein
MMAGRIQRAFRESFLPLVLLLAGLLAATLLLDRKATEAARRLTVVKLSPASGAWNPDRVGEDGIGEGAAEAAEDDEASGADLDAARALARAGDLPGAAAALEKALAGAPGKATLWNELAVYRLRAGNPDAAAEAADKAVAADPAYFRAYFTRGVVRSRKGDAAGARADYEAALKIRPLHFESAYNLGLMHLEAGDAERAEALLRQATDLTGGDGKSRAFLGLGRALARLGRKADAAEAYERAIRYTPGYLAPRLNLAMLLASDGTPEGMAGAQRRIDEALALQPDCAPAFFLRGVLASRSGDDEKALAAYEAASRNDPRFWKARYNFGVVALRLGRTAEAQQAFLRLAADFPERPEPPFNLGRIAYRHQDFTTARTQYEKALELAKGDYPEAALNLGLVDRATDEPEKALKRFDDLLARDPANASALMNRGLVLRDLKRDDEARAAFQAALKARPNHATALFNLGRLEASQKRHKEAMEAFEQALAVDPRNIKSWLSLGVARVASGDLPGAEDAYRKAIEISPGYVSAHYNLATALRKQGRPAEAVTEYQKVLELDEEHANARLHLGLLYGKLGQGELAVRTLDDALDRDPSAVNVRYSLAQQYRAMGRTDAAAVELRRVLRMQPEHEPSLAALASLELDAGRLDSVGALLEPVAAGTAASARVRVLLATARLRQGRVEEARQGLDAALAREPENVEALRGMADVMERQGDAAGAATMRDRARAAAARDAGKGGVPTGQGSTGGEG